MPPAIFKFDTQAIIEPFVDNLVEYVVPMRRVGGEIRTSPVIAAENARSCWTSRPRRPAGAPGTASQGMLSLTRDINPQAAGGARAPGRAAQGVAPDPVR